MGNSVEYKHRFKKYISDKMIVLGVCGYLRPIKGLNV